MVQTINPDYKITVHIEWYDEPYNNYVAWIDGEKYRGMVVSENSLDEVLKELSISVKVLELYRKNQMPKKELPWVAKSVVTNNSTDNNPEGV